MNATTKAPRRAVTPFPLSIIAERNAANGWHWFEPDTKRFFGSRVGAYGYASLNGARVYFVSSEWTGFDRRRRAYSVRVADLETGKVDTEGTFGGYETRAQAIAAAKRAARGDA